MSNFAVAAIACTVLTWGVEVTAADSSGADLLRTLRLGDQPARVAAIEELGRRGGQPEGAVAALISQLDDDSPLIRAHAAHALGQIGPAAKQAAEVLAKRVFDKDPTVRREAVEAYRNIRPGPEVSVGLFVKLFEEADPEVRLYAMDAMAEAGREAVPGLIQALASKKATYWACLVLGEIGPDAQAAVPALIQVVRTDDRPEVRREAIIALATIGPKAAPAVSALIEVFDEKEQLNVGPAAFALGAIGPKAKAAEEKLRRLAEDSDSPEFLQTVALWALARLNPDDQPLVRKVVPRLVEALKSPQPRLRAAAARALIDLDPDPEIVRPALQKVMEEASPEVLNDVLDALAGLGERAVPRLIRALDEKQVRAKAAAIVARIGPPAKAAVPALIKALGDENPQTRNEVLFALAAIGPDAKSAVPALIEALGDPDMNVRYSACYALGRIGRAAMPANAALQKKLGGADQFLALASAWALARIDPESPETCRKSVPIFCKALSETDAKTRVQAADSLRCLGPLAKDAVPALKKALRDEDESVRQTAAEALKAIGG